MERIKDHRDLKVYQLSFEVAMEIFQVTKSFPNEEKYSLTDQIKRSSRSVSANIAEAWRKRRYEKAFIAKLSDAEGEASETQVWLDFAFSCEYINKDVFTALKEKYDSIIGMIINMIHHSQKWIL